MLAVYDRDLCQTCRGKGYVWVWIQRLRLSHRLECSACGGSGFLEDSDGSSTCGGASLGWAAAWSAPELVYVGSA
jgi:DnaJ-class molecular chaperone